MALIDNVSLAELVSAPSVMRYVMVGTVPLAFASGVKVQVPSALMMIEPLPAMTAVVPAAYCVASPRMRKEVTVGVVPSTSVSFVRTLPVRTTSSVTVEVSSIPRGASLTAVMVNVIVFVAVTVPSVAV